MTDKKLITGVAIGVGSVLLLELLVFALASFSLSNKLPMDKVVQPSVTLMQTPSSSITITVTPTDSATVTPTVSVSAYKYSYSTEAVVYEPNTSDFVGFRVCDTKNSTCTVYGAKSEEIAYVLGGTYKLSFNDQKACTAAAGTSYCEVLGKFRVTPL